jgi:transposase
LGGASSLRGNIARPRPALRLCPVGEVTVHCGLDGPAGAESFRACIEQCVDPTLRQGDIVILDRLASHKAAGIKHLIEAAGAELRHLPACSPDINPIERLFTRIKVLLRKAAGRIPRCRDRGYC